MKSIFKLFALVMMFLMADSAFAQNKKYETMKIKTSAECGQCKKTIEKALMYEKGVKSAKLDVETKEVEVVYKPSKTNPDRIRDIITGAGYDADDKKANNKAYQQLEECCKKGGMENHKEGH